MRHWKSFVAKAVLAALGGIGVSAAVAVAQPSAPRDPNMPDPKNVPAEKVAPPLSTNTPGQTLSEKLQQSEGVIKPPADIDPGIAKPAPVPNPGTTLVIPPPGEPGGNPNVQPK